MPPRNRRLRAVAVTGSALVLAVAGYAAYTGFGHGSPPLPAPGCQAGTGVAAISLDTGQAGVAATIAGVAARQRLPRRAVTIAYAAALQESQMQNLAYGDLDSVGVFQQRPSQGWGTASELRDPVYASTRFFDALVQVHGYTKMPVDQAAQDVQHSADGTAYQQWAPLAAALSGYFTGAPPHDVSCWYTPPARADLAAATRQLTQTFGPQGQAGVVIRITTDRSDKNQDGSVAVVHARQDAAWTVVGWLVAHAQDYGISDVRYAGYEWNAADGSMGWRRAGPAQGQPLGQALGSIVAG
ncbi:MAG TPA: hypothetical protein VGY96_12820 [Streptosporangiaceae bacterium]|nr:hypothetical protein [Streptosporangiaceae bacterium]